MEDFQRIADLPSYMRTPDQNAKFFHYQQNPPTLPHRPTMPVTSSNQSPPTVAGHPTVLVPSTESPSTVANPAGRSIFSPQPRNSARSSLFQQQSFQCSSSPWPSWNPSAPAPSSASSWRKTCPPAGAAPTPLDALPSVPDRRSPRRPCTLDRLRQPSGPCALRRHAHGGESTDHGRDLSTLYTAPYGATNVCSSLTSSAQAKVKYPAFFRLSDPPAPSRLI